MKRTSEFVGTHLNKCSSYFDRHRREENHHLETSTEEQHGVCSTIEIETNARRKQTIRIDEKKNFDINDLHIYLIDDFALVLSAESQDFETLVKNDGLD